MTQWIASLPMYDFESIKEQTDRLWLLIRQNLPDTLGAPEYLCRKTGSLIEHWKIDNLYLSQSCGWPLITELNIEPLVTPIYDLPGCGEGYYSSAIIVRHDSELETLQQLSNARLVISGTNSWSGYHTLQQSFKHWGLSFEKNQPLISGSHQQSLNEIFNKRADFAAIDAVSWHHLHHHNTNFESLKVLDWTLRVPALPLISRLSDKIQSEVRDSLLSMETKNFKTVADLGIVGFKHFTLEQYRKALRY